MAENKPGIVPVASVNGMQMHDFDNMMEAVRALESAAVKADQAQGGIRRSHARTADKNKGAEDALAQLRGIITTLTQKPMAISDGKAVMYPSGRKLRVLQDLHKSVNVFLNDSSYPDKQFETIKAHITQVKGEFQSRNEFAELDGERDWEPAAKDENLHASSKNDLKRRIQQFRYVPPVRGEYKPDETAALLRDIKETARSMYIAERDTNTIAEDQLRYQFYHENGAEPLPVEQPAQNDPDNDEDMLEAEEDIQAERQKQQPRKKRKTSHARSKARKAASIKQEDATDEPRKGGKREKPKTPKSRVTRKSE